MADYTGLVKSLRWLSYMFPETHPAKDDTDRISNNIHLYCKSAADAIEELSSPEWISVSDRLPERDKYVLVFVKGAYDDGEEFQYISSDYHNGVRFDQYSELVTHWMPMPEPPKEENQ